MEIQYHIPAEEVVRIRADQMPIHTDPDTNIEYYELSEGGHISVGTFWAAIAVTAPDGEAIEARFRYQISRAQGMMGASLFWLNRTNSDGSVDIWYEATYT